MNGIIRLALPAAGVLILVFTRKRWMKNLVAPMNLGSWVLASFWAVLPAALFFVGFALEKKKMYSHRGLLTVVIILLGIWGVTALPALLLGVFKSIRSSKIRESYARARGFNYHKERIENDLLPKSFSEFNPILSNILTVKPGVLIACASKVNRGPRRTMMRGKDIALIDGISVHGTLGAVRRKQRSAMQNRSGEKPEGLKGLFHDCAVDIGEDEYLVITSENNLKDFFNSSDVNKRKVEDAKETARSCLELITRERSETSRRIAALYIHGGRLILELDGFLDSDEKLDSFVRIAKKASEWSPPPLTKSSSGS